MTTKLSMRNDFNLTISDSITKVLRDEASYDALSYMNGWNMISDIEKKSSQDKGQMHYLIIKCTIIMKTGKIYL